MLSNYQNTGSLYLQYGKKEKDKAISITVRGGPLGCETSRFSHFLDNRLTDGGEVACLARRSPFTPRKIPGTGGVDPGATVRLDGLGQLKNPVISYGIESAKLQYVFKAASVHIKTTKRRTAILSNTPNMSSIAFTAAGSLATRQIVLLEGTARTCSFWCPHREETNRSYFQRPRRPRNRRFTSNPPSWTCTGHLHIVLELRRAKSTTAS
jgi:hypothetical protein